MMFGYPPKIYRIFSAAEYLKFIKSSANREAVSKVRIIPPTLGTSDWGGIYVEFDYEPGQIPDLPKELIPDFIEIQKLKTLNESKKLHLKEKEMDYVSKYSEQMLDHHIQMMNQGSLENRKSFTRLGLIVGILILIVLGFLTAWICLGKEQFAFKFMQGMAYLLSTVLGYWVGIKSKARNSEKKQVATEQVETVE